MDIFCVYCMSQYSIFTVGKDFVIFSLKSALEIKMTQRKMCVSGQQSL